MPLETGELCRCKVCERDWNDDGTPAYFITKVYWDGPFETPCRHVTNSRWSVEQINAGAVAWLCSVGLDRPVAIRAGTTMDDFIAQITAAGGTVFPPLSTTDQQQAGM